MSAWISFFDHIAFDLDDTLLDTSGGLVPLAAQRACEAMIRAGLKDREGRPFTVEELIERRNEIIRMSPRADVWRELARLGGDTESSGFERQRDAIAQAGRDDFYRHDVDALPASAIRPQEGAIELLKFAKEHSVLHLVSAGDPEIQNKKIDRLGIRSQFESISIVENRAGAKGRAFQSIEHAHRKNATMRFLSVGNRVDTDLGEAKRLGWSTAWIRSGEHVGIVPQSPEEIPDLEVATPKVLLSIWSQALIKKS